MSVRMNTSSLLVTKMETNTDIPGVSRIGTTENNIENKANEVSKINVSKMRLLRCSDWLQKQNNQEIKKSLQNKNDIQFIIQNNTDRKKFLLAAAEDVATVPQGIDEVPVEPRFVPLQRLRVDNLHMECEWQSCTWHFSNYELFQSHVKEHLPEIPAIASNKDGNDVMYVCLWDVCGFKAPDFNEVIRHVNFHVYHAKLLAIGFNGRATLKLARCKKDSCKRNQLPPLKAEHQCMWTGCKEKFNSIQAFFNHVRIHSNYSDDNLCSWAGCGAKFPRRVTLTMHVRSHTNEKLIACYHCGHHFANNRKLCDHLRRQNVSEGSSYLCPVCGLACATEYLVREHARQHVSAYACAACDMSAPSRASLALHVRYRHLPTRAHACRVCSHTSVTQRDLQRHMLTHQKKKKKVNQDPVSDSENSEKEIEVKKTEREKKQYACHMCPEKQIKVFSRGTRLTSHLVKVHGAQWPFGHSRFRYQISEDGMYRLTTTRYEFLEVSRKIVDGYSGPKESFTNSYEYDVKQVAEETENTPRRFEISLKRPPEECETKEAVKTENKNSVEITMCDVDEEGNIISSEVIQSNVVYA